MVLVCGRCSKWKCFYARRTSINCGIAYSLSLSRRRTSSALSRLPFGLACSAACMLSCCVMRWYATNAMGTGQSDRGQRSFSGAARVASWQGMKIVSFSLSAFKGPTRSRPSCRNPWNDGGGGDSSAYCCCYRLVFSPSAPSFRPPNSARRPPPRAGRLFDWASLFGTALFPAA